MPWGTVADFFILLFISYWKGFGKIFGSNLNSVLNDFGGHVGMMTGSASNAMDVLCTCESLLIG